jgi:hypothetical protein
MFYKKYIIPTFKNKNQHLEKQNNSLKKKNIRKDFFYFLYIYKKYYE